MCLACRCCQVPLTSCNTAALTQSLGTGPVHGDSTGHDMGGMVAQRAEGGGAWYTANTLGQAVRAWLRPALSCQWPWAGPWHSDDGSLAALPLLCETAGRMREGLEHTWMPMPTLYVLLPSPSPPPPLAVTSPQTPRHGGPGAGGAAAACEAPAGSLEVAAMPTVCCPQTTLWFELI